MNKKFQLDIPYLDTQKSIDVQGNLIIVGANGAGKTRLGAWIELNSPQRASVHRISAQKSLAMPDSSSTTSYQKAESGLLYGNQDANHENGPSYRQGHRWGNRPAISLLSDYERLMVYLFSEDYDQSTKYRQLAKLTQDRVDPPETKIDIAKKIWEEILPHRELTIGGGSVRTNVKGSTGATYNASEMSDGERVIFYLIGQCLAAQKDGIIIIDEPELHLHKSIQVPLWNELEKYRSDCLFIYITHDVDFSASKESSAKIWLKSFNGTQWDWELIESVEGMPEDLLLEVIGSRKPVVFVEGENGSYDVSLYRAVLNGFLVIPIGSCAQVIQAVKALRENKQLHHLNIYGLIDRDRRVDSELAALESAKIYALSVAEVENLFCTPEVLKVLANKLEKDPVALLEEVKGFVFQKIEKELETQVSLRCAAEVRFNLNRFDENARGVSGIQDALNRLVDSIDIQSIFADAELAIKNAILNKDYEAVLRMYNRKSLASQIGAIFGFKSHELPEYVVRLAKGSASAEISRALKPYFGNFSTYIA